MRVYLDIEPNPNLEEGAMATFTVDGPAEPVRRLRLWLGETWQWCAVCALSAQGAAAATWQPIEESGDGPAGLVWGGAWGLRLARVAGPQAAEPTWDVDDATQWAEPFLICRPEVERRA